MFDVSFTELMVIAVVALIVIGPERLPKVARTAGHILGRLQRYVSAVKSDINREMQLEELKKLQQQVADQVKGVESSMASATHEINEIGASLGKAVEPVAEATETAQATLPLDQFQPPADAIKTAAAPASAIPLAVSPAAAGGEVQGGNANV